MYLGVSCNKLKKVAEQANRLGPAGREKNRVPTGLVHWSGHFDQKLGGYFKIRTKSRQNDKNLSGQNLPSAEQASVRIIRGPP